MPLRIRCPHCRRVLVVEDELAGQTAACPECGKPMQVPLPRNMPVPDAVEKTTFPRCPRCDTELALTATFCFRCHTDLHTGRRLPWRRRLKHMSWRFWTIAGCSAAVGAIGIFALVQVWLIRSQAATATYDPARPRDVPASAMAEALLVAQDADQRRAALDAMRGVELRAADAVAEALVASLAKGAGGIETTHNRLAAIALLARQAQAVEGISAAWTRSLTACDDDIALRAAARAARGRMRDLSVLDALAAQWLESLEKRALLERLRALTTPEDPRGLNLALRRLEAALTLTFGGLRELAREDQTAVLSRVVARYWDARAWLGQRDGEHLAGAIFVLAQPGNDAMVFRPEDVRGARDALHRVAAQGDTSIGAAAGLIITQRTPQYRSVRREIGETLGRRLPDCDAACQQRVAWAVGRLVERQFGPEQRNDPIEVTRDEVAAIQAWARPGEPPVLGASYPEPPRLVYRAVTAGRQMEEVLLREMRTGWTAAELAADRWRAWNLGATPRLLDAVYAGQRQPNYVLLATAMTLLAEYNERGAQAQLELWRDATDQPAWVSALAYTALASLDARRGVWSSPWPKGLDPGDRQALAAGQPGWGTFGRVIAAGGPRMLDRLERADSGTLAAEDRDELLRAARAAMEGGRR